MQQLIQTMIAPAVMISCCGLLLLSIINKLGRIIDRIRDLNTELREYKDEETPTRIVSIEHQIAMLVHRAILLKRSTSVLFLSIFFYVLTSFGIGVYSFFQKLGGWLTFLFFIVGMVCLLLGVLYAYWEIRISHTTIVEEIKETADLIKKGPAS
jgi:hypothetical protein